MAHGNSGWLQRGSRQEPAGPAVRHLLPPTAYSRLQHVGAEVLVVPRERPRDVQRRRRLASCAGGGLLSNRQVHVLHGAVTPDQRIEGRKKGLGQR